MSQNKRLESILKRRWLTQLQAYDAIQCTRLAARSRISGIPALTCMTGGLRRTQVSESRLIESLSPVVWLMPLRMIS